MAAGRNGMSLDWSQREFREGLRCFHSGAFFEAHEHWESVWLVAQEPEKTFLQGLIQVAASFHHFQRGNLAGTASLLRSALRRLDVYPEAFAGVAVAPLRATIRLWLDVSARPEASVTTFTALGSSSSCTEAIGVASVPTCACGCACSTAATWSMSAGGMSGSSA